MLKQILLETYKPEEKLISFIKKIPTEDGKSELIEKTNIKLINPVVIIIKKENTKLEIWSYQNEEILNKSYYIPVLNKAFSYERLKEAILRELSVKGV